jgi:Tfp pilus assembly protein PilF
MVNSLTNFSVERFVRKFKKRLMDHKHKFAFFLGAGCSVSSGIPGSKDLVSQWLKSLYYEETGNKFNGEDPQYINWLKKRYPDYTYEKGADIYKDVIKDLCPHIQERKAEFEKLIQGKDPAFGYGVFAQLIGNSKYGEYCNIILTTNFDDLVADALYIYSQKKPLVIPHGSLAGFVRLTSKTPIIIKIHGDVMLEIENTEDETDEIDTRFKGKLDDILKETGIIFIGYGGNDKGVLNILENLSKEHLKNGIYWINNKLPDNPQFIKWLEDRDAIWVKTESFDKLMLNFYKEFNLSHPDENRFKKLLDSYYDIFKKLKNELKSVEETGVYKDVTKGTIWDVWSQASEIERSDPQKADFIYLNGLKNFPNDATLTNLYALFLKEIRKDYDNAEKYYKKALELDPNDAVATGNYAIFLDETRKDYNDAEKYYKKALELDPNDAGTTGNYAIFLDERKDHDNAEKYYKKALELDPNDAGVTINYALFLDEIRKDYDNAEKYYKKALELDPNDAGIMGNFALFLDKTRKDYDNAEKYYKKALELDPNDAGITNNYALFLGKIQDYDNAEKYYKKTLELVPDDAGLTINYALFLDETRKDYDNAEKYYKKALELDPNDAGIMGSFALFLDETRKDYDNAEKYYKKALELDPNNAGVISNYALFLDETRKDYDNAEKYYKTALELDPNDVGVTGNYALFLDKTRKDYDNAEKYYKKALELDPNDVGITGNYALFLDETRKDYDNAEKYYKTALELDPNNARVIGDYAFFLYAIRNDYDNAEKYYKRAVELDPNDAGIICDYAIFLDKTKKDYDNAEKCYKRAVELDPNDADLAGNYAGFLLAKGNKIDGKMFLDRAFDLLSIDDDPILRLECLFYCYAHFFDDENMIKNYFKQITSLLDQGVRSLGWDFSANIEKARHEGHPYPDMLKILAHRISEP